MTKREELERKIEELVWMAWGNGNLAGHPMVSERKSDDLHNEVWMELKEVLEHLNSL